MTIEQVLAEIERRVAQYRDGAATYPDLDQAADMLADLAVWIVQEQRKTGRA